MDTIRYQTNKQLDLLKLFIIRMKNVVVNVIIVPFLYPSVHLV
jgi:hypothetical protein